MDDNMERTGSSGFFDRLGWIFYAPSRVFDDIERGAVSWWQPWIWLGLISMLVAFLSLPVQRLVMQLTAEDYPGEMFQKILDHWSLIAAFQIISAPVTVLLLFLVTGLIGYIFISLISSGSSFKRFFTLYLYAGIVESVGGLLSILIVRFLRGLPEIRGPEDAAFSIGLGFLAPPESKLMGAVFSSFDLFAVWGLVLIALGLMHIFKMTRNQAVACVIPFWLMSVIMLLFRGARGG